MLKGNGELVDNRRAELKANLETNETRAHDEAINVGSGNNWTEELIVAYTNFLLDRDPRYDVESVKKELDYIETHFCNEVPDEDITANEFN